MKPLQVGQRVKLKGKVVAKFDPKADRLVCIELESGQWCFVTPSQCTPITKKERRRVWVCFSADGNVDSCSIGKYSDSIEFVEVRRKTK